MFSNLEPDDQPAARLPAEYPPAGVWQLDAASLPAVPQTQQQNTASGVQTSVLQLLKQSRQHKADSQPKSQLQNGPAIARK